MSRNMKSESDFVELLLITPYDTNQQMRIYIQTKGLRVEHLAYALDRLPLHHGVRQFHHT